MNACFGCEVELPPFKAFCSSTCEGIFYASTTNECGPCQESYRHDGYTKDGMPVMACPTCGERFECTPLEVA